MDVFSYPNITLLFLWHKNKNMDLKRGKKSSCINIFYLKEILYLNFGLGVPVANVKYSQTSEFGTS